MAQGKATVDMGGSFTYGGSSGKVANMLYLSKVRRIAPLEAVAKLNGSFWEKTQSATFSASVKQHSMS